MTETQSNSITRLIETGSDVNFDLARNAAVACGADAEFLKDLERRIEIEEFISQSPDSRKRLSRKMIGTMSLQAFKNMCLGSMSPSDRQAYHDLNWSGSEYAPKFEGFSIAIGDFTTPDL